MRILVLTFLWVMACPLARSTVAPITESEQAPKALKILTTYHGQRPADPPKKLHIVYYTPADRAPAPQYEQRLATIMEDIRAFYRDGMEQRGFGPETFALEHDAQGKLVIYLVKGKEAEASFPVWKDRRGTGDPSGGETVKRECASTLTAAGISFENETTLIFCNLANWDEKARTFRHHSPYFGMWDQASGLCFAADSEILSLNDIPLTEPILDDEEYGKMSLGKFNTIFIGGIAHELGHALALPHCGERWDEKAIGTSLMGMGNHTYREERRGDGKGSFLTMASAMHLAGHPLFAASKKGLGDKPEIQRCDLSLSTNVTRQDLSGRKGALRLEGTVHASPPVYGIIAYFDSVHDGGYRAPAATSVPDSDGQFAIEVSDLVPCGNGELRVEFCHANGAVSERRLGFSVTPEGLVDISQWQTRRVLEPIAEAVASGRVGEAQSALTEVEKTEVSNRAKTIARKLVATLQSEVKLIPAVVPADVTELPLGDAKPQSATVGWLEPAANRVPRNNEINSPLLDSGKIYATGLFAHSPSRYVFDLGGKWKRLRGEAGLHTVHQQHAWGVVFIVKLDGKEVFRSPAIRGSENPSYDIDVSGGKTLELIVDKSGERNGANWGLWLEPTLTR